MLNIIPKCQIRMPKDLPGSIWHLSGTLLAPLGHSLGSFGLPFGLLEGPLRSPFGLVGETVEPLGHRLDLLSASSWSIQGRPEIVFAPFWKGWGGSWVPFGLLHWTFPP